MNFVNTLKAQVDKGCKQIISLKQQIHTTENNAELTLNADELMAEKR